MSVLSRHCSYHHYIRDCVCSPSVYMLWKMLSPSAPSKDDDISTHLIPHILLPVWHRQSIERWMLGRAFVTARSIESCKGDALWLLILLINAIWFSETHTVRPWVTVLEAELPWSCHTEEIACRWRAMPGEPRLSQKSYSSIPRRGTRHVAEEGFERTQTQESHERPQDRIPQLRCYQIPDPPNCEG